MPFGFVFVQAFRGKVPRRLRPAKSLFRRQLDWHSCLRDVQWPFLRKIE